MKVTLVTKEPKEGQWFKVNPKTIDCDLFKKKRKNPKQESTRQLILEAFKELKENPSRYSGIFYTMMPAKIWVKKSAKEHKEYASNLGGSIADWVEQALEWAQRIKNGESWKAVCNEPDTANWFRLVKWKDNTLRIIGGSKILQDISPSSRVYHYNYHTRAKLHNVVPLIVLHEE